MSSGPFVLDDSDALRQVQAEFEQFRQAVQHHHAELKVAGIALFLATLGCWSVSSAILQAMAYGIAMVIFGDHMSSKRSGAKASFARQRQDLRRRIESAPEFTFSVRGDLLNELDAVWHQELSGVVIWRRNTVFFMSWTFFALSAAAALPFGRVLLG